MAQAEVPRQERGRDCYAVGRRSQCVTICSTYSRLIRSGHRLEDDPDVARADLGILRARELSAQGSLIVSWGRPEVAKRSQEYNLSGTSGLASMRTGAEVNCQRPALLLSSCPH